MLNGLRDHLSQWGRMTRDVLYPPRCAYCDGDLSRGDGELLLCEPCGELLGPRRRVSCRRCGATTPTELPAPAACARCRPVRLRFEGVVSLGTYQGDLRRAVLRMKRRGSESLSESVGRLLWQRRNDRLAAAEPEAVVAVPMFWLRRCMRGTNSSEIVADYLGRALGVPMIQGALMRWRNTRPQADLSPRERLQNVRGAFRLRSGCDLAGARLLLVDDILTTGATCNEIAGVLLEAGAAAVSVAVVARAE